MFKYRALVSVAVGSKLSTSVPFLIQAINTIIRAKIGFEQYIY